MPTECNPKLCEFAPVEGRQVVAGFDGGTIRPGRNTNRGAAGGCVATGAPATFIAEQICAIMARAYEPREQSALPLSHWSQSELAREAVKRGIVDGISYGSVGHFFKTVRHRVVGWLTPKPEHEFAAKCADVCTVYHDAVAAAQQDIRTVSIDEMRGVQALERAAPDLLIGLRRL
jgi:hypothetical protein